jgi:putative hydrolase of the HAD superfamily
VVIEALIFDFDGLLMDTESTLLESWRYEWRQHGLELDEHGFFADHGGDLTEQRYTELATAVGPGYDHVVSHARRTAYRDRLHQRLDAAPGIRAWFDRAAGLGLRLAVASSSPHRWVSGHLSRSGLDVHIELMACGDEVSAHKPDPAVYRLAMERLSVDPAQAIAFEDTPHGVASAQAAGLFCVAVPNAFTPTERFAMADLVLPSAAAADLDTVIAHARAGRPARRVSGRSGTSAGQRE